MRCRNCHTVMMDTDPECPVCHASAASATAPPPGPISNKPNGLAMLLPMFGGAVGGLLYGALTAGSNSQGVARPSTGSSSGAIKWGFGLFFLIAGGLFLLIAFFQFNDAWKIARWEPKVVTAAELRKTDGNKSVPGAWLAYTFDESRPTDLTVTRRRLGKGGDVKVQCLLVRVEDKWLFASVAPGFEGNQLVGRLVPLDSPPQQLVERLKAMDPKSATLLPYEFNGVDGTASDQRKRFTAAGILGFFGLVGLVLGLCMIRGKRQPAVTMNPVPATIGSSFLPAQSR